VLGPDSLSRFDELRRREAARTAIIYAFDLIEHDGEDLRMRPLPARKAALARLLRNTTAGLVLNEHVAGDGPTVFEHACGLGAEGHRVREDRRHLSVRSCPVWVKGRNPASIAVQRERSERWNR
jgi:bifunctional non-homologous end joining protein LigD